MKTNITAILLAGGKGVRMLSEFPKQFIPIHNIPLALYSFRILANSPLINQVVVVCGEEFQPLFQKKTPFAQPGTRRQDSLFNGFQKISAETTHVLVHDAARPCIDEEMIERVVKAGIDHGAATVGMPIKFTIKRGDSNHFVKETPDRETLWEVQTPQIVLREWLEEGFTHCQQNKITVTDDVSIAELLNHPVKLIEGTYRNLKVTTKEDLQLVETYLKP